MEQKQHDTIPVGATPVCGHCGASAVMREAWAVWNRTRCRWELQAVFDQYRCEACDRDTEVAWQVDETFRKERIRDLNDALRQGEVMHGSIVVTQGIQALGDIACAAILGAVAAFTEFTSDNDPHEEHDFGSITHDGSKIFWKIDYYDRALQAHSPDEANPEVTQRVLTIMLAQEY